MPVMSPDPPPASVPVSKYVGVVVSAAQSAILPSIQIFTPVHETGWKLNVTLLSVDVEGLLVFPVRSETPLAWIVGITVPELFMPLMETLKVVPLFGATSLIAAVFVPPAVPPIVTSDAVNVATLIDSLKTTVKSIGLAVVGST